MEENFGFKTWMCWLQSNPWRYCFFSRYYNNLEPVDLRYCNELQNKINQLTPEFEKLLYSVLGNRIEIANINIFATNYGTGASYFFIDKEMNIKLFLRKDRPLEIIFEQVINSIVHTDLQKSYIKGKAIRRVWQNKNIILDYLYRFTPLSSAFLDEKSLIKVLETKIPHALRQESISYLNKLGFQSKPSIVIKDNQLFNTSKQEVIKHLTFEEEKVLKFLLINKNNIVTFSEIGDVIWGKESTQKYSLYAISRLIFEIRRKLKANSINKEIIQTQRKKGYYLSP